MSWDDDDWTGEPPEGRHTRDQAKPGFWQNQWQAKPGFWQNQWQAKVASAVLGLLVLIVALVLLLG